MQRRGSFVYSPGSGHRSPRVASSDSPEAEKSAIRAQKQALYYLLVHIRIAMLRVVEVVFLARDALLRWREVLFRNGGRRDSETRRLEQAMLQEIRQVGGASKKGKTNLWNNLRSPGSLVFVRYVNAR